MKEKSYIFTKLNIAYAQKCVILWRDRATTEQVTNNMLSKMLVTQYELLV